MFTEVIVRVSSSFRHFLRCSAVRVGLFGASGWKGELLGPGLSASPENSSGLGLKVGALVAVVELRRSKRKKRGRPLVPSKGRGHQGLVRVVCCFLAG